VKVAATIGTVVATLLLALPAQALPEQHARVSTGFWDGVTEPSYCRIEETDPSLADVDCVATEASLRIIYPPPDRQRTEVTSVGSSVVMARATPGSVGASAYNGYIVGWDNYYGYAEARTKDEVTISGGTPDGTVTVAVGSIVNGGLGIYGSDAGASARAYFRFQGQSGITGSTEVFNDRAYGEEVFDDDGSLLPPHHVYDYSVRNDFRFVDIALDAAGNGSFIVELLIDVSAFEEGDENLYESAAAADYGSTIDAYLQPWSSDFIISSEWQVRSFGLPLSMSPEPVTLTPEQLGLVPEPALGVLLSFSFAALLRRSRPSHLP